jgi:hypothetical protein
VGLGPVVIPQYRQRLSSVLSSDGLGTAQWVTGATKWSAMSSAGTGEAIWETAHFVPSVLFSAGTSEVQWVPVPPGPAAVGRIPMMRVRTGF